MNLKEFMDNPAGKGDSSTNRTVLKKELDDKFDRLLRNPKKIMTARFYKAKNKDIYYIHVVIPSETERTNSYDVVLRFSDDTNSHQSDLSILNYDIRIFCNAPSFAYTFAKVYYDNNMLINELASKYNRDIIRKQPEVRNRYHIINYDKYAYFAAKYLYESRFLSKMSLQNRCVTYSESGLKTSVRSLDEIMSEYKKAADKLKRKKEDEKKQFESSKKSLTRPNTSADGGIKRILPKQAKVAELKKRTPKPKKTKSTKRLKGTSGVKKKI